MATAIIPDEGMQRWSELSDGGDIVLSLRLFKNDFEPDKDSILADFTVANFNGYANQVVDGFGIVTVSSPEASSNTATHTFNFGLGGTTNTIYGWYLVETTFNTVLACNRLAVPKVMAAFGDSISITLTKIVGDLP